MLHVISVEKNSLMSNLGAQNVERHFALNVIRGGSKGCIRCGEPIEDLT
jgi:hypothetical protein